MSQCLLFTWYEFSCMVNLCGHNKICMHLLNVVIIIFQHINNWHFLQKKCLVWRKWKHFPRSRENTLWLGYVIALDFFWCFVVQTENTKSDYHQRFLASFSNIRLKGTDGNVSSLILFFTFKHVNYSIKCFDFLLNNSQLQREFNWIMFSPLKVCLEMWFLLFSVQS